MTGRILFVLFFFITVFANAQVNSVKEIVQRMSKANASLQTAKFTMLSEERLISGKFVATKRYVKLQVHPKKIYFFSVQPNPGTEIIWKDGWMDNKMLVSPKSFPYVTFNLKLTSSIARKDTHHSILDLGFEYVTGLIDHYAKLYGDKFYNSVTISDTVQWDNRSCIVVDCEFKDYAVADYVVKHGENVMDCFLFPGPVDLPVPMVVRNHVRHQSSVHHQFTDPIALRMLVPKQELLRDRKSVV